MRIIGIDPGYAICGYGIIDVIGSSLKPVAYGVITTEAKTPEARRLEIIFNELSDILEEFRPQKFGIEKLYFARNVTTGIRYLLFRRRHFQVASLRTVYGSPSCYRYCTSQLLC